MKVALAQMEVKPGAPGKNLEAMLGMIERAKLEGVDLIAFPEMSVGGYLLGDKWLSDDYCEGLMEFNEALRKASDGIAVAYGNIFVDREINERVGDEKPHPNKDGRSRKYNAVYVFQNGMPAQRLKETNLLPEGVQPKTLLPNYRFFDDERYFFSTEDVAKDFGAALEDLVQPFVIDVKGKKVPVGFEVCEDLWCADYRRNGEAQNATRILIGNGAQLVVNISASPWTYGKNAARDRRIRFLKGESGNSFVPFLYVNCTGVQNTGKNFITFDGGSTVYNSDGLPVRLSKAAYEQELMIVDEEEFFRSPVVRLEKPMIAQKYEAIVEGIRHMKDFMGLQEQPRYVIGLSGGIDSAVVAALLTVAVGPEKVLAINMPTHVNSARTMQAAAGIAESLGIGYVEIPIEELTNANIALIDRFDLDGSGKKLAESSYVENVAAKIRGTAILSNLAGMYGALFTNNGNKDEIMLGYATLYGDVGGALSPIGDLTKAEVFELARYLNREIFGREVLPEELIPDRLYRFRDDQIKSGPELKEGQVSPIKFGYHCAFVNAMTDYMRKSPEQIMRWYIEGALEENLGISTELIRRWGMDDPKEFVSDLEWFIAKAEGNVFKRVQSPPIIVVSKSAYGYDIRESILPNGRMPAYERLKAEVLAMVRYVPKDWADGAQKDGTGAVAGAHAVAVAGVMAA